jgi:hypothetical protein
MQVAKSLMLIMLFSYEFSGNKEGVPGTLPEKYLDLSRVDSVDV